MEKTTWPHPTIVKWIEDNAIAISADLDAMRRGAEIQKVNAVPALIAFKDGKELDRTVGYQTPDQLLPWLESLKDGKTIDERLLAEIAALPKNGGEEEVDARYDLARRLSRSGHPEEATEQYIWLWNNIPNMDTGYDGVRVSFMAGDMESVALACPPCREKFAALRDALVPRINPGPDFDREAFNDWVVLNERVLGDDRAIILWGETAEIPPALRDDWRDPFRPARDALIELKRWDLAARLISDPAAHARNCTRMARERNEITKQTGPEHATDPEYIATMARIDRNRLAELHGLALVLGVDVDARAIADEAIAFDPSDDMRIALVQAALSANQVRRMHVELLESCPTASEHLRTLITEALTTPASPQTPPPTPAP